MGNLTFTISLLINKDKAVTLSYHPYPNFVPKMPVTAFSPPRGQDSIWDHRLYLAASLVYFFPGTLSLSLSLMTLIFKNTILASLFQIYKIFLNWGLCVFPYLESNYVPPARIPPK